MSSPESPSPSNESSHADSNDLREDYEALLYENRKLKSINKVLMQRVELGWGNHSDAYRSFENAALLADKVRDRTQQLQQTLNRLEETNAELANARTDSDQARQRLVDAMESISDSFVLFDADRKLVMANSRFSEFWNIGPTLFKVGETTLADIIDHATRVGVIDAKEKPHEKIGRGGNMSQVVFRLRNGRWIQMTERPTSDGGLAVIYSDITELKEGEASRHQQAVAKQALLLQSTLENMSQGVALVNGDQKLEFWNRRFIEISKLPEDQVRLGSDFEHLLSKTELSQQSEVTTKVSNTPGSGYFESDQTLQDGRVLLIRRHEIPGGGYLNTYADVTERSQQANALRESEERIRLITDAMPAMISYVNRDLQYEFVNRSFEDWFDRPRDQILGRELRELLGDNEFASHSTYIETALSGRSVSFENTQTIGSKKDRISRKSYIPHFDENNKVCGFFALEQDITQQRRTAQALQQAYEYMEQRVRVRTREISEINQQLRNEIEERQAIAASLTEAKREAEQANESKTKFLAAASHDLLQPMNAARLFASALQDQPINDDAAQLVESLSFSLENVESLISLLVDISKLEAGVVEAVQDSFVVDELLSRMAREFYPQVERARLELKYVPSKAVIYSDSQLLARIIRNLLTNAVRYTETGKILLGCRRRPNGVEIQVLDTGIGVPEDKLVEIFQEFSRVNPKENRSDKGLGLGLAIVDRIARVLGCEIRVNSQLGKGSCFSITVPFGQPIIEIEKPAVELDSLGKSLRDAQVLVIDNDMEICAGMSSLLGGWGCNVTALQTLDELQDYLGNLETVPEVVIADYHLDDGQTGIEAIDIIHESGLKDFPVIMVTANHDRALRKKARSLGYMMLNKPIKPLKLKAVLANVLSQ